MAQDFGSGVSRTLSALQRGFAQVVWQKSKPILDSELNLIAQIDLERMQEFVRAQMHSGFIIDPTAALNDYVTNEAWSNWFQLGNVPDGSSAPVLWANVNGWVIPVVGTAQVEGDPSNRIDLFPPPSSDLRWDFVFLEVWLAQVAPNPSTANKPAADGLWKYGNVKYGGDAITDDIQDPATGYETSERLQVQYRLRVFGSGSGAGSSVALSDYPDGLDDPNVLGQGAAASPVAGLTWTNMGELLGDPGLWRAGDGDPDNDLATVDGYTYAIPVCAIRRRNSDTWVARTNGGAPNHPGAFERNPVSVGITDPADATLTLTTPVLVSSITEATTGVVQVADLVGSGLDDADHDWTRTFLVIDDEIIGISGVNTGVSPATITITSRGRYGTHATTHAAETAIRFYNSRPDGLWADQIVGKDILDLRKAVNIGDWDYQRLLQHNLTKLLRGDLRSTWKESGEGQDEGVYITEVSELDKAFTPATGTEGVAGPDGIRTIFSDAATIQPDVTFFLNPNAAQSGGRQVADFANDTANWDLSGALEPVAGFMADTTAPPNAEWENGTVLFVYIDNARDSMNGAKNVRFLTPREYDLVQATDATLGNVHPVSLRFIEQTWSQPAIDGETAANHPGPMYPTRESNYEYPFLVLGGILHPDLQVAAGVTVVPETGPGAEDWEVELTGLNFDTAGSWFTKTGTTFDNDPSLVSKPLLNGTRTLYDMLTAGGTDLSGNSSEVYLVLWGDDTAPNVTNNGAFRVVGAGATAGYTQINATAADRVRVVPVGVDFTDFIASSNLSAEFRSQYSTTEDGLGSASGRSAMCVVLTDINDTVNTRWSTAATFTGTGIAGRASLRTTLQYGPGYGATKRIGSELVKFGASLLVNDELYLRQIPEVDDLTFPGLAGIESGEVYWDWSHIQTWNRLSSRGLDAPDAPAYGGQTVSFSEQDREAELFIDLGSKTILFRPYQQKAVTLTRRTSTDFMPEFFDVGNTIPTDPYAIFGGRTDAFALPPEVMPRFGRQDIPYFTDASSPLGQLTFLAGFNHLFVDATSSRFSEDQFEIIGGDDTSGAGVAQFYFMTGSGTGSSYGEQGSIPGGGALTALQGRLIEDLSVVSTDISPGLRGIELPPFYGIARLYGVYDLRDFNGSTFDPDRVTPDGASPPNLLRTDATKQTMFIRQGGGEDLTGNADDHTYIVPEQALDITLSDSYVDGETFMDLDFVVVATVFGFSRGFINKNTYVLHRTSNAGSAATGPTYGDVNMVVPAAATNASVLYTAYNRTPYQGDPYMTRDGNNRVTNDYEDRYGRITQGNASGLANAIQQYDSDGNFIPETPNPRTLQVLASVDFYTTLGTGSIGGPLYPGTVTDVGYIENTALASTRVPADASDAPWAVSARAFTAGQPDSNPDRAFAEVQIAQNGNILAGDTFTVGSTTFEADTDFAIGANAGDTASNLIAAIRASNEPVSVLSGYYNTDTPAAGFTIFADYHGAAGNSIVVATSRPSSFRIVTGRSTRTATNTTLKGGVDVPVNGGTGQTPVSLTGLTERLPLGILLQDSDFLGEDPVRDSTGQLFSGIGMISANGAVPVPLAEGGIEYSRLIGGPGQYIGQADAAILSYTAYDEVSNPTGSRRFRLYRGGGTVWVLSGDRPGGPVDWVSASFPDGLKPVLKGGVLVGKALLVRNFPERALDSNARTSYGDEIQMVVLTRGYLGKDTDIEHGIGLNGSISPSGYGEGYAAADRYRLDGKPQMSGSRAGPDPSVELAPFPFTDLTVNSGCSCG